jgi:hypothetical protein
MQKNDNIRRRKDKGEERLQVQGPKPKKEKDRMTKAKG